MNKTYICIILLCVALLQVSASRWNKDRVDQHNREKHSWQAADYGDRPLFKVLNHSMAMRTEEDRANNLPPHVKELVREYYSVSPGGSRKREEFPENFLVDPACLAPIITQGQCGSCWYVTCNIVITFVSIPHT